MYDDLSTPERVVNVVRSIAMLPPRAPALNREEAIHVLEALVAALLETKKRQD